MTDDKLDTIIAKLNRLERVLDSLIQDPPRKIYPKPAENPWTIPYPTTPWPLTDSGTTCSKCGLRFEGVTGYVCTHSKCPLFMVVSSIVEPKE